MLLGLLSVSFLINTQLWANLIFGFNIKKHLFKIFKHVKEIKYYVLTKSKIKYGHIFKTQSIILSFSHKLSTWRIIDGLY